MYLQDEETAEDATRFLQTGERPEDLTREDPLVNGIKSRWEGFKKLFKRSQVGQDFPTLPGVKS